jgi:phosphoglycerate dehydrogenase-like enzyme
LVISQRASAVNDCCSVGGMAYMPPCSPWPLYDHLVRHPRFTASIDAWWIEPVRHGEFRINQPFLDLPNVIASPHNSGQGGDAHDIALRRAVENCRRALTGEAPLHVIGLDERLI